MKKQFAIIGLGRFGGSVTKELVEQGADVLAIDSDRTKADEFRDIATQVVIANATDEQVLRELDIPLYEHVVVAIGNDIEASILATLLLSEMGVKHICVKAETDHHEKVLKKIGAHRVLHPEREMGARLAHHLLSDNIVDYIELSSQDTIIEAVATPSLIGRTIQDLNIRALYGCTIIAIRRQGRLMAAPQANEGIQAEDILVLLGPKKAIYAFEKDFISN